MGYLLSQQLVAAGERVIDVPATLAARTRVLGSGRSNKTDPNDARSVALTALRHRQLRDVQPVGHGDVLRLLAKRNNEIGARRTQVVGRIHTLLVDLAPGGISVRSGFLTSSRSWTACHRRHRSSAPVASWSSNSSTSCACWTLN